MESLINDIYWGTLDPSGDQFKHSKRLSEMKKEESESRKAFFETLPQEFKERFKEIIQQKDDIERASSEEIFSLGFSIGMRLASEAFLGQPHTD